MWRRKRQDDFHGLRARLLALDPFTAGISPTPRLPTVWGGMMEVGLEAGAATVVMLANGTTSLYTSAGGGVLGGGEHGHVRALTERFLAKLERRAALLAPDHGNELPAAGVTVLRALTYRGRVAAAATHEELGGGDHLLSSAFFAGHEVITALREI